MKSLNVIVSGLITVVAATMLSGCSSSYQARSVDLKSGDNLLVDPAILQKGEGQQALYRYANPKADIRKYDKVVIDPVIILKKGDLDARARENFQTLANNSYVYLSRELGKDYQIVKSPGQGTLRIQFAIIDAESMKPVRNFIGSVDPIGVGLSLADFGATGEQMGVGEITGEFKLTDATTDELLAAALDRRVGGRSVKGTFLLWEHANAGLEYWAKKIRYALCEQRSGGVNCINPDN